MSGDTTAAGSDGTLRPSSPAVQARLGRQRVRDTAPELALRQLLHAGGLRYRVDVAPLPELRRRADVVWSEALGWPLVWDQDQETAIRSPRGGPKITWGGPPLMPKTGKNRLHFDFAPPVPRDLQGEVARLVSLGRLESTSARARSAAW